MAKKKAARRPPAPPDNPPASDDVVGQPPSDTYAATVPGSSPAKPPPPAVEAPAPPSPATVELILAELHPREYVTTHVETRLNPRRGAVMCQLYNALHATGARCTPNRPGDPGEPVNSHAAALRWLLDQVADATPIPIE